MSGSSSAQIARACLYRGMTCGAPVGVDADSLQLLYGHACPRLHEWRRDDVDRQGRALRADVMARAAVKLVALAFDQLMRLVQVELANARVGEYFLAPVDVRLHGLVGGEDEIGCRTDAFVDHVHNLLAVHGV